MSRFRLFLALLVLASVFAGTCGGLRPAYGQKPQPNAADTTTLTFEESVRLALRQNTDVKRAEANARLSQTQVQSEWQDFTPSARLSTGLSRSFGRSFSQVEGEIITRTTDFFNARASIGLPLFNGFENIASLRSARAQAEARELSLRRARRKTVFTVIEQYIAVIESRELIRIQEEEVAARRQQLDQIRRFVEAGGRPPSDLYQAEANVAEARQNLLEARRDRDIRKTKLVKTLQLDPRRAYRFERLDFAADTLGQEPYDLSSLITTAFEERLDLQAATARRRAAERSVRAARSAYYPHLSVSAGYGSSWTSRARSLPGLSGEPSFMRQLDNNRSGSVGLSVSIPIYDQGRRSRQVQQAEVQAQRARYDLQDRRQEIALQVRQAYVGYRNAAQQLKVAKQRVKATEQARATVREQYNLGSTSIVDLQDATRNYVEAASKQVQARYNLLLQRKRIEFHTGRLSANDPLLGLSNSGK